MVQIATLKSSRIGLMSVINEIEIHPNMFLVSASALPLCLSLCYTDHRLCSSRNPRSNCMILRIL